MSTRGQRRARRGAKEWRAILQRFEGAGQGTRAFCRREGVALSSFQRWRQRLDRPAAAPFVELVAAPASAPPVAWALEVSLPNGTTLRFRG